MIKIHGFVVLANARSFPVLVPNTSFEFVGGSAGAR